MALFMSSIVTGCLGLPTIPFRDRMSRVAATCRDVAADLIGLLVPAEAEPRAVNRQALAISTVARQAADWMDAAHFVLLGFFI